MPICLKCKEEFKRSVKIHGKLVFLQRRNCCLNCIPYNSNKRYREESIPFIDNVKNCTCKICNKEYSFRKGKSVNQYICNSCRSTIRRTSLKKELVMYKGGKCEICGYSKCNRALTFHHNDPLKKEFTISLNMASKNIDELKKEVDKCTLLCNNCHSEVHDQLDK
jgi:hypothetical protein